MFIAFGKQRKWSMIVLILNFACGFTVVMEEARDRLASMGIGRRGTTVNNQEVQQTLVDQEEVIGKMVTQSLLGLTSHLPSSLLFCSL